MKLSALRRWLHDLTVQHDDLHEELKQSAIQRDLSRERLRRVQARLDVLQAAVDVETARRRRKGPIHP